MKRLATSLVLLLASAAAATAQDPGIATVQAPLLGAQGEPLGRPKVRRAAASPKTMLIRIRMVRVSVRD